MSNFTANVYAFMSDKGVVYGSDSSRPWALYKSIITVTAPQFYAQVVSPETDASIYHYSRELKSDESTR